MKKIFTLLLAATLGASAMAQVDATATMTDLFSATEAETQTATFVFSEMGYENAQAIETASNNGVTLTFDKGTNNNAPKYYNTGASVRLYGSNSMTVTADGNKIVKIEFTFGSGDGSNELTSDPEGLESTVWTGSAESVMFTVGGTSGHRRFATVAVTYEAGEGNNETQEIALTAEDFVIDTVVDNSWGTNDIYYTATVRIAKPEGAKYIYSEGLHLELNGENTGVPFQFGMWGFQAIAEEEDYITLVYKDAMIAKTDDAYYEGDLRAAGTYKGMTEIAFLDENQMELPVFAKFEGEIVLPSLAEETEEIEIILTAEDFVIDTVVDNSWGTNDVYYTATVRIAKPEGAKYIYSEGLHLELNGENTGVPFQFGMWGFQAIEEEGDMITIVYKDAMIAKTDDAAYEGDLRAAGTYKGMTEIAFLNEDQWELPVIAKFEGEIVLPETTSGLSEIKFNAENVMINLNGQRVNEAKGIVIRNGKKVSVK